MAKESKKVFELDVQCPHCYQHIIVPVTIDVGVLHMVVRWHPEPQSVKTGDAILGPAVGEKLPGPGPVTRLLLNMPTDGGKRFHLTVPTNLGGPCVGDPEKPTAFGLERIAPGVWVLNPSLLVPGVLHAFVVVVGVPEPAPWEDPFVRGRVGT